MNQFHFIDMQCTADSTSEIIPFNTGRKDNSHIIVTEDLNQKGLCQIQAQPFLYNNLLT